MQHVRLVLTCLSVFCSLFGCRDAEGDNLDRDTYGDGGNAALAMQQALALSDDLLAFDPALDGSVSAEENAMAVQANAMLSLGSCGTVTLAGTTVTVDLGTGCTTPSGLTAGGSISAAVTVAAGTVTATLTFAEVTVGTFTIDGSATFSTTDGTTYAASLALDTGARAVSADVVVTGLSATSWTFDGTATVTRSGGSLALDVASLTWVRGDCYPSNGAITVGSGAVTQTITFDAETASTGAVTVTQGRRSTTETLPPYADCPSA